MANSTSISVNRSSPVPLYFQVAEQLERAILDGSLGPGERISNEVALAQELGLSRPTMRQAIQVLVDKGLLVRKRGVGTQVVRGQVSRPLELTSLFDDLTQAGARVGTQVLSLDSIEPDAETSAALQLAAGDQVWRLERLRFVGDEPLAHMLNFLPVSLADLGSVDFTAVGLYETLRRSGVVMRVAQQRICARRAEPAEAKLLHEKRGAPLLTMERTAFDDAGNGVEVGIHAYRPALYAFESTLVHR